VEEGINIVLRGAVPCPTRHELLMELLTPSFVSSTLWGDHLIGTLHCTSQTGAGSWALILGIGQSFQNKTHILGRAIPVVDMKLKRR